MHTDGIDNLLPVIERTTIEREQPVTGLQAGSLGRPLWIEFGQDRRQCRTPRTNPQRMDRVGLVSPFEPLVQHKFTRRVGRGTLFAHHYLQRTAFAQATHQLQVHRSPAGSRLTINGHDFLAGAQTCLGRNTPGLDSADDRTHLLAAEHCQYPEERQCQQEVGNRPRRYDGNALTNGFTIEGLIKLIERYFTFALVEHFDVAAQRNGGDDKFGAPLVVPAQQRHAEAYGEAQHLDPTATRDPKMAELVEGNQHTQSDQGADNHIERAHLLSPQSYPLLPRPTIRSIYRP
ncbi:hypothetical protein D3C76_537050 [compost metagenome]